MKAICRRSDELTHFGHVAFHAADSNEFCIGYFCNDASESCLSTAGWSVENHGRQTIRFDCTAQKFARRKNVFLADKFVECARSHARGQRRSAIGALMIGVILLLEKVVHAKKYGALAFSASHFGFIATGDLLWPTDYPVEYTGGEHATHPGSD